MAGILSRNLILVAINQAIVSLGSAALIIIFAHFLGQALFGELRYVVAVLAIFAFCSLPGIGLIINQNVVSMSATELRTLIRRQVEWSTVAVLGALMFALWHSLQGESDIAKAFAAGALLAPLANLFLMPGLICAGHSEFTRKTVLDALVIGSAVLGGLAGVLYAEHLYGIVFWYLGSQAIATLCAFYLVRDKLFPTHETATLPNLQDHLREGVQLTLTQIPFQFIPAIEKVLIYIILGPVSLAIFVIAVLPIEHFKAAFRSLIQVYMLPHLTISSAYTTMHWLAVGLLVLSSGALLLVLFILYGMAFFFADYHEIMAFSLALTLSLLPLPIHVIAVSWIARRRLRTLTQFAGMSVLVNILVIGGGAWMFGLWGAVVAKIVYEMVLATALVQLDRPSTYSPV